MNMNDCCFNFLITWVLAGGLIPQHVAAKLLGVTPTYVCQLVSGKKLSVYDFDKARFVSFREVLQLKIQRSSKK